MLDNYYERKKNLTVMKSRFRAPRYIAYYKTSLWLYVTKITFAKYLAFHLGR